MRICADRAGNDAIDCDADEVVYATSASSSSSLMFLPDMFVWL